MVIHIMEVTTHTDLITTIIMYPILEEEDLAILDHHITLITLTEAMVTLPIREVITLEEVVVTTLTIIDQVIADQATKLIIEETVTQVITIAAEVLTQDLLMALVHIITLAITIALLIVAIITIITTLEVLIHVVVTLLLLLHTHAVVEVVMVEDLEALLAVEVVHVVATVDNI